MDPILDLRTFERIRDLRERWLDPIEEDLEETEGEDGSTYREDSEDRPMAGPARKDGQNGKNL